ncbi:MAG: hypothetical protein WBQ14_02000 [Gaiellaceae bacterium]
MSPQAVLQDSTAVHEFRGHEVSRLIAGAIALFVTGLAGWTIFLALTLPGSHQARHWDAAWVGFDIGLIVALGLTAWAAWFRRQVLVVAALVTATLLVCDAWFDVTTSWGTGDQALTLVTALLAELPLAGVLFWLARRIMLRTFAACRARLGEEGSDVPLHEIPLLLGRSPKVEPGSAGGGRAPMPSSTDDEQ